MTASRPASRTAFGSPMQYTQVIPASRMYLSLVASVVSSSILKIPNSPRRSEWPIMTFVIPKAFICSTDISPVYAPQPLKLQFCGVTMAPFVVLPMHEETWSGVGQKYTSHLLVSQASMFAMSPGSFAGSSGLHFQLPPTIGFRPEGPANSNGLETKGVGAHNSTGADRAALLGIAAAPFASEMALTISANSGFSDAPPTRNPSISGCADSSGAFLAFAEPPY
mmetsp:Transcript_80151/g.132497  ORF Transcript_80151/g.132497 Transcript_80151/m.132497 type:complete len:223 (-) Transcript_80151:306-974(-)